jgi:futalosine hydrolase
MFLAGNINHEAKLRMMNGQLPLKPMKLLITAATWNEIKPLEEYLLRADDDGKLLSHCIEISVTGIGGVQTAFHLGKTLGPGNWDFAMQLGICGSFKKNLPIGTTVNVVEDCFADLGAEDGENFLDAFQIELLDANKFPFTNGKLENLTLSPITANEGTALVLEKLSRVKGISVNKVHGNEKSIQKIILKFNPDVESMEGAAFFYCCKMMSVPFLQLRTVSNFVETRDKSGWNIALAIKNLNEAAISIIKSMMM